MFLEGEDITGTSQGFFTGRRVRPYSFILSVLTLVIAFCVSPTALASPGEPDRNMHPYVGVLVYDLGGGLVDPYCHVTLISPIEAVTANHCAPRGSRVSLTVDNPVLIPAKIHMGTSRMGGWDFGQYEVDVAIIDLDEPIDLPRYAQVPTEPMGYQPGVTLDYVTYNGAKQSTLVSQGSIHGRQPDQNYQNEPAHVEFDRNVMRTMAIPGAHQYDTATTIDVTIPTCYGNSGSPIFPAGSDVILGVLSYGPEFCTGGGDSYFARTDNELARGILNGTVTPPPPATAYPHHVEGSGTSGALTFPATVQANATYTGAVTGLTPADESTGSVGQDEWVVFDVSVQLGFRSFLAALRHEYVSDPTDDLDLYLVWYISGVPYAFFWSEAFFTSDETAFFTNEDLASVAAYGVDDLYNFQVWVHGYDTGGGTSDFTLFTDELTTGDDEGNLTVQPTTSGDDPHVTIDIEWSDLDPSRHMYFGLIDHYLDGVPEPTSKSTYVEIHTSD